MGNVFHNRASLLPQCSLFRSFQLTLLVISSVHPQGWQPRMQETRNEDLHSHEMDWGALWWILILASLLLSNFCCYALCSSFATTLPTKVLHFVLFCNSCDLLSLDREISLSILRQLRFEGSTPTSQELSSSIFQSLSGIGNIRPNIHFFRKA